MKSQMSKFALIAVGLLMGVTIATSPGCAFSEYFGAGSSAADQQARLQADVDRLEMAVDRVDLGIDTVSDYIESQQVLLDTLPDDSEMIEAIQEGMSTAQAELLRFQSHKAELDAVIATTNESIANIDLDGDGVSASLQVGGDTVSTVSGLLPAPFNAIGLLLGGALGAFGEHRARKHKRDLTNTVFAIDVGKRKSESMAKGLNEVGGDIMSAMGEKTAARVDKIRKTK